MELNGKGLFRSLTIGARLTISFAIIMALMAGAAAFALLQLGLVQGRVHRLYQVDQRSIAVLRVHSDLLMLRDRLESSLQTQDASRFATEALPLSQDLLEELERAKQALAIPYPNVSERATWLPMLEMVQHTLPSQVSELTALAESGDWSAVRLRLENQVRALSSVTASLAEEVDREVASERSDTLKDIESLHQRVLFLSLISACLTLFTAAGLGLAVTRSITRPLSRLRSAANALARGEFQHQIAVAGRNELADLARVFNDTGGKLRNLYGELRDREARFRSLIEHSSDLIMTLDRMGTISYASPGSARVVGFEPRELAGRSIFQFLSTDNLDGAFHVPGQGVSQTVELSFRHANGHTLILETIVSNLLDEPVVGAVIVNARDVTERKRADEEVRHAYSQLTKELSERKRAENEIKLLSERLINAQEEERRRIARELHDDFSQQIAVLSLSVAKLKRDISESEFVLREGMDQLHHKLVKLAESVRHLSHQLHPAVLEHSGVTAALRSYCSEFASISGVNVTLETDDTFADLPPAVASCVYRIAQEALQNVARHSGAKNARVELRRSNGSLCFAVSDSGRGFLPGEAGPEPGLGLVSMKERARLVHGTVYVESEPNRGTKLRITIPLSGSAG